MTLAGNGEGGSHTFVMRAYAYARASTPGRRSGQAHDDCQRLDEEDGEQNVFGDRSYRGRRMRPPIAAEDECRKGRRHDDAGFEDRDGDRRSNHRCGWPRLPAFRCRAARVSVSRGRGVPCTRMVRFAAVHRACTRVCATCHALFRCGRPPCTRRRISSDQAQAEKGSRKAVQQTHHWTLGRLLRTYRASTSVHELVWDSMYRHRHEGNFRQEVAKFHPGTSLVNASRVPMLVLLLCRGATHRKLGRRSCSCECHVSSSLAMTARRWRSGHGSLSP